MARVSEIAAKVRSKNAGPFWLTIDIFCGSAEAFDRLRGALGDDRVARALGCAPAALKRFDIAELSVIKFSLPRPQVQGSIRDRDMHGASFANLVAELEIEDA
ncbi:DUF4387 family protein [Jhaorihella thermophila]|uniref:DUF4387 domain-containing protein n=1 Tax=Jhaorihella thermophila TaxID=488547 RepID=A0A1H5TJN7_9RHOB|nr:DUF4387 family protein [Jhaorihella thermophila]SEF62984.1 protein of unknown function [Jhaorihella thermophila]